MTQHSISVFETSRATTTPLELIVSGPGCEEGERHVFEHPFALVGRDERSCLHLEDDAVSRRHAYLQQLGGRVFCLDLGSRTGIRWGGETHPAGWLRPEQGAQIGPFTLELAITAQIEGAAEDPIAADWDPLQDRAGNSELLPRITVEMDNKVLSRLHMNRALLLVGSSPACRLRLRDGSISRYQCSLVRTPQGVWVVDLLFGTGVCLNGQSLRYALVKEGDRLQVGPYVLRVSYPVPPSRESRVESEKTQEESLALPAAVPPSLLALRSAESDQTREHQREIETLRQQLANSRAKCEWFRERARALDIEVAGMDDLQAQLEAAETRVRELTIVRDERDRWRSEAQVLQARLTANEAEREEKRQQLEASEVRIRELASIQDERDRWQTEAQDLQSRLVAAESEGAERRQQLEAAEASVRDFAVIRGERDRWQTEAQELQARLAAAESEREEGQQQLETAQHQLVEEREAVRAMGARRDEESAALQGVRAELADSNAELSAAQQLLQEAQDELTRAQDETHRLQAELTEAQERQRDIETLKQELAESRIQHAELCIRVPELEDRANSLDRLRMQFHDVEAETERLRMQLRTAESRSAELEAAHVEREQLREQVRGLEGEVAGMADLQDRFDVAEGRIRELEGVRDERDRWQSEVRDHQVRLTSAEAEREERRQQFEVSEARIRELDELVRIERDRWQAGAHELEARLATVEAERDEARQQLEVVEASVCELAGIGGERDRWQAEVQDLQTRLAGNLADQEQHHRLAADLHATQMERDQLLSEQHLCRSSAEQARNRVSELERALVEAVASHTTTLEEARAGWEGEKQSLQARLDHEGQGRQGAVQAALREIQGRAAAERETLRQQVEGAERQVVWEREMFQEQIQQLRQQVARLQAERNHLAGRLQPAETPSAAVPERSQETRPAIEMQSLGQQDAREQVFAQLSALQSTVRTQHTDLLSELVPAHAPIARERALVEEQRRLATIAQEIHAGWGEASLGQERLSVACDPPNNMGGQVSAVGEEEVIVSQSASTANEGESSAPSDPPPKLWRHILGLVRGK